MVPGIVFKNGGMRTRERAASAKMNPVGARIMIQHPTRLRGDKVRVLAWDEDAGPPSPAVLASEGLRVGDLVHDYDGYRAINSMVVTEAGTLLPIGEDTNGDGRVNLNVTRFIEDPLDFYETCLEVVLSEVELDTTLHAEVLADAEITPMEGLVHAPGVVLWSLGEFYH